MNQRTTTALTGGVELLERAMGYTLGGLLLVTPEAMSNPTPCDEWDLRELLLHMNDSLFTLHEAIVVGHLYLDPSADGVDPNADYGDPALDPVASLRNRACQMVGAWANARERVEISIADLALTAGIVAATGAVEVAVHGWDVARACGQDRPIPPALAGELLELCQLLVSDTDRPTRFAPPVDVPRQADPGDRLVAYLGRRPRWRCHAATAAVRG
jgi:uncharacterized protein (TIGR03086 family)